MSEDEVQRLRQVVADLTGETVRLQGELNLALSISDDWRDVARVIAREWIPLKDLQKAYVDNVFLHIYEKRQNGEC